MKSNFIAKDFLPLQPLSNQSALEKKEERRGSSVARLRTKKLLKKDLTDLTMVRLRFLFSWLQDEAPPIRIEPDLR
jgi:hypothetical protein